LQEKLNKKLINWSRNAFFSLFEENIPGFNAMEGEKFSFFGHCTPDFDPIIEAIVFKC